MVKRRGRRPRRRSNTTVNRPQISGQSDIMELYLRDIAQYHPLSSEDEAKLAARIKRGDKAAADKLVRSNLRFVVSVARTYQDQGLPLSDLIAVGNTGLVKAAERFDEKKNFRFISYAVWWIRQAILQELANQSRVFKVPLNRVSEVYRVGRVEERLEQKYKRRPSVEEISEEVGLNENGVETAIRIASRHVSLDSPISETGTAVVADVVKSDEEESPEQDVSRESAEEALRSQLKHLSKREREVVELYFGLGRDMPATLDDIGAKLGLTRERVRQVKDRALDTLRTEEMREFLKEHAH